MMCICFFGIFVLAKCFGEMGVEGRGEGGKGKVIREHALVFVFRYWKLDWELESAAAAKGWHERSE